MLTADDREVLGMAPERVKVRRPSAVSQVLRAINDELARGPGKWELSGDGDGLPGYDMIVASDRTTRQRAYALAHRVYRGCGYVPNAQELIVSPFDANPATLTLLAVDDNGNDAATITLVFDSEDGLPCDEIYRGELNALRAQGRKLVEVTRLAIHEDHQCSKTLLVRLFNFIYIFARRVRGFDDLVIEVNPRHVNFYHRLLIFEQAGPQRPCPRVQDAPAVLLKGDLGVGDREVKRVGGKGAAANERTLYPYFYSWLEEAVVAEFLARSHTPMNADDAVYFGLRRDTTFQRAPFLAAGN